MKNLVNISIECKPVEKLAHSKVVFCLNVHVDKNLDKDSNITIDDQKKQWKNEKNKAYRKVRSTNKSRLLTHLVYNYTQNDNFLIRSMSHINHRIGPQFCRHHIQRNLKKKVF